MDIFQAFLSGSQSRESVRVILASFFFECKEWRSRPQGIAICGFVLCGRRSVPWGAPVVMEEEEVVFHEFVVEDSW